jgi:hypothetical protein
MAAGSGMDAFRFRQVAQSLVETGDTPARLRRRTVSPLDHGVV